MGDFQVESTIKGDTILKEKLSKKLVDIRIKKESMWKTFFDKKLHFYRIKEIYRQEQIKNVKSKITKKVVVTITKDNITKLLKKYLKIK